jgi:hypothetical protein
MSSGGSNDPTPSITQKPKKIIKVKRVVYDPTFAPMPHTNGDGETSEANGNGETSDELYKEGTYDDLVEDVVDRYDRFVIRPDGGSGYVFIVLLIYYLC